jgi:hypothetical protein
LSHIAVRKVNMNKGETTGNGKMMRNRRKFLRHIILG